MTKRTFLTTDEWHVVELILSNNILKVFLDGVEVS